MTYPFAPVMYIVPFLFEDGESSSEDQLGKFGYRMGASVEKTGMIGGFVHEIDR